MGACLGEAIGGKKLGKKAMLFGIFANNLPDIDIFANFWVSTAHGLLTHRGITHSILFECVFTLVFALAAKKIFRKYDMSLKRWILMFGSGLFLHVMMDSLTTYGTGLFEPFSHARVSLNTLFILDPFLMLPILTCAIVLWIKKRISPNRKLIAMTGLSVSACYLLFTIIIKLHVNSHIKNELKEQQIAYKDFMAAPTPLNNLLWYTMVKSNDHYHSGYYSIFDKGRMRFNRFEKNDSLLHGFENSRDVQFLIRFTKDYYCLRKKDSITVFSDLRFGLVDGWRDKNSGFVFNFDLKKIGDSVIVRQSDFRDAKTDDIKELIKRAKGVRNKPFPQVPSERMEYLIFGYACNIHSKLPPVEMYMLKNDKLIISARDFFGPFNELCYGCDTVTGELFQKANQLKKDLPGMLLQTKEHVYGQPDSLGHCGAYMEFKLDSLVYRINIDEEENDLPAEILELRKKIDAAVKDMHPSMH
jgi:inner membrane protein